MMINLLWPGVKCETVQCFFRKKDFISGNVRRKINFQKCLSSKARQYCHKNGANLWYPSNPIITGHIVDHDENRNRSIPDALLDIFDLFGKDLELQERTHLELAWTSIQRLVQ